MPTRSTLIDTIKLLASQLIVWHHLSLYSPMAPLMSETSPTLMGFIVDEGRLVVQCFLVIAGFLAAQSFLVQQPVPLWRGIAGRYLRLAPQFTVALLLLLLVMRWVQGFYQPDWVSAMPSLGEFAAHVLMLQGVLDIPSLSAGAWYVAIDFQLYVSFALLWWLFPKTPSKALAPALPCLVALLSVASLLWWSRLDRLDIWAVYFWGAYGLGVLAAWGRASSLARGLLVAVLLVVLADAAWSFRSRPVLAAGTAMALWAWGEGVALPRALRTVWYALSDASYAIFVTHFAVIVCLSAVWTRWAVQGVLNAWIFFLVSWGLSVLLGLAVNRWVKTPKFRAGIVRS